MSKPYTNAAAVADALNVASGALALAHSLAQQHGIELVSRIEEVSHMVSGIYDDADRMHRDSALAAHLLPRLRDAILDGRVSMKGGQVNVHVPKTEAELMMPVDVANVLVNLTPSERNVARVVSINQPYEAPSANDAVLCRALVRKGVLDHDKSKDRYSVAPKFERHLG